MCRSPGWKALGLCYAEQLAQLPGCTSPPDLLRTSPDLQVTCGQSQQCLMTCCCLDFSELVVSVLFPRDGSLQQENKACVWHLCGRLSRGNALCLPASLQSCLCHHLSLGDVTHSQYKLSAIGLISQQLCCFTQMGDPGQRNYGWMDVWVLWCCSFFLGVPSLLQTFLCTWQSSSTITQGQEKLALSEVLLLSLSATIWHLLRALFSFPLEENTMIVCNWDGYFNLVWFIFHSLLAAHWDWPSPIHYAFLIWSCPHNPLVNSAQETGCYQKTGVMHSYTWAQPGQATHCYFGKLLYVVFFLFKNTHIAA